MALLVTLLPDRLLAFVDESSDWKNARALLSTLFPKFTSVETVRFLILEAAVAFLFTCISRLVTKVHSCIDRRQRSRPRMQMWSRQGVREVF